MLRRTGDLPEALRARLRGKGAAEQDASTVPPIADRRELRTLPPQDAPQMRSIKADATLLQRFAGEWVSESVKWKAPKGATKEEQDKTDAMNLFGQTTFHLVLAEDGTGIFRFNMQFLLGSNSDTKTINKWTATADRVVLDNEDELSYRGNRLVLSAEVAEVVFVRKPTR